MGVSVITYILVMIFASSSWLSTNSMWMELPLLTAELPEQWSLPSYLAVIVQLASLGPLVYSIVVKFVHKELKPAPVIVAMLVFGCFCTVAMAVFWRNTANVFGSEHSLVLFVLFFGMALVNCTSNVLFLPYMATFHHSYITAYFVGMGFSALIPGVVSLIQGTGQFECVSHFDPVKNETEVQPKYIEARFGVSAYNLLMFLWMCTALFAFCLLHWSKFGREGGHMTRSENQKRQTDGASDGNRFQQSEDENTPLSSASEREVGSDGDARSGEAVQRLGSAASDNNHTTIRSPFQLSMVKCIALLMMTAWVCGLMNGVIPSVQSFASLPYGQLTYHLALTLSNIANPIACFVPFLLKARSLKLFSVMVLMATIISAYIVLLAAMSPEPVLVNHWGGAAICVLAAIFALGLQAYLRTAMAGVLREGTSSSNSENVLFWCGVFTQIGSFLGAFVMFPLVSVYQVFKSAPPCR